MDSDKSEAPQGAGVSWIRLTMVIAAIVATAWILVSRSSADSSRPALQLPPQPVPIDVAQRLGSDQAQTVIIAFSDFECPACRRFAQSTFPSLKEDFIDTGRVQFAFVHFPLPSHKAGASAAEVSECAAMQGRFWTMHDIFFSDPMRLEEKDLRVAELDPRFDQANLRTCSSEGAKNRIASARALGVSLKISSTPTFLVGRRGSDGRVTVATAMTGAMPLPDFVRVLDALPAR